MGSATEGSRDLAVVPRERLHAGADADADADTEDNRRGDGGDDEPKAGKGGLSRVWRRVRRLIGRLPGGIRLLLALAGAGILTFGGTTLGNGLKILASQGWDAFLVYMGKEPFAPLFERYPVLLVLLLALAGAVVVISRIIKAQDQYRSIFQPAERGAEKGAKRALEQQGRIRDADLPRVWARYLEEVVERYDHLDLPVVDVALRAIAVPLPLWRRTERSRRGRPQSVPDGEDRPPEGLEGLAGGRSLRRPFKPRTVWAENVDRALKMRRIPHIVLMGDADSGKTTLLKLQVVNAAREALADVSRGARPEHPVPVYLAATDLVAAGSWLSCLHKVLDGMGVDRRLAHDLREAIDHGQAIVCVDGLDRVETGRRSALVELVNQAAESPGTGTVASCWLLATRASQQAQRQLPLRQFTFWQVGDLATSPGSDQPAAAATPLQRKLAQALFSAALRHQGDADATDTGGPAGTAQVEERSKAFLQALYADARTFSWRGNPLLFSQAAMLYTLADRLPASRVELYRQVVEIVLGGEESSDEIGRRLMRRVLGDLALWLYQGRRRTFTTDDLLMFLVDIEREPTLEAEKTAKRLLGLGVLEESGDAQWNFRYDMFLDYFATVALAQGLMSQDERRRARARDMALTARFVPGRQAAIALLAPLLVQEYGPRGREAAIAWLHALLRLGASDDGDPASQGLRLALDSLDEMEQLPEQWLEQGLGEELALAWLDELRRQAERGQPEHRGLLRSAAQRLQALHEGFIARAAMQAVLGRLGYTRGGDAQASAADAHVREIYAQVVLALRDELPLGSLTRVLHEGTPLERETAARILWDLPETLDGRREALTAALSDPSWPVRFLALTGLGSAAPADAIAAGLADDAPPAVRIAADAARTLGASAGPSGWVGRLLRLHWAHEGLIFSPERLTVRACAVGVSLECFGTLIQDGLRDVAGAAAASREATTGSIAAITAPEVSAETAKRSGATDNQRGTAGESGTRTDEHSASATAVHALRALGILNDALVASLRAALADGNDYVRAGAALGLGGLVEIRAVNAGDAGRPMDYLRDHRAVVRLAALVWLVIDDDDDEIEAGLREALGDAAVLVRVFSTALVGLAAIEQDPEEAEWRALLIDQLRDHSTSVRLLSVVLLLLAEPPVALARLMEQLNTGEPSVRVLALVLIGILGWRRRLDQDVPAAGIEHALRDEHGWFVRAIAGVMLECLAVRDALRGEVPPPLLGATLESADPGARVLALVALAATGWLGDTAQPEMVRMLLHALGDREAVVASVAALALGALELGSKLDDALPEQALLGLLDRREPWVRVVAIAALAVLADAGRIVKPAPLERFTRLAGAEAPGDRSAVVRTSSALGIAILADARTHRQQAELLRRLDGALKDGNWWVKMSAAAGWVVGVPGTPPRKVAAALRSEENVWLSFGTAVLMAARYEPGKLVPLLRDLGAARSQPRDVLRHALRQLRGRGRRDPLADGLRDSSETRRWRAASGLAALDGLRVVLGESDEAVQAVAVLVQGCLYVAQQVRQETIHLPQTNLSGLGGMGAFLQGFLGELVKLVPDLLREGLLQSVLETGSIPRPDRAVARLVTGTHWAISAAAVVELGLFGWLAPLESDDAQRVVTALHDVRADGQAWVRGAAGVVLGSGLLDAYDDLEWTDADTSAAVGGLGAWMLIGWEAFTRWVTAQVPVEALADTMGSRADWLRAAGALGQGLLAATSTHLRERIRVDRLIRLLSDDSVTVRTSAIMALGQLGERTPSDEIRARLTDDDWRVRAAALRVLARQGEALPLAAIHERVGDRNWYVQTMAVRALGARGDVPGLLRALDHSSAVVRAAAALELSRAQRARVDPLVAALGDPDGYVRQLTGEGRRSGALPNSNLGDAANVGADDAAVARRAAAALSDLGRRVPPSRIAAALDERSTGLDPTVLATDWLGVILTALTWIEGGLDDASWRMRVLVTLVLGVITDPHAEALLRRALSDGHPAVRQAAASMLARRESSVSDVTLTAERPWTGLLDLIFVAGEDVRIAVGDRLREMGDSAPAGNGIMAQLAALFPGLQRPQVTESLTRRLEALLDWPDWTVRANAATALAELHATLSETAMRRLLKLRRGDKEAPAWATRAIDDALQVVLPPLGRRSDSG